MTSQPYRVLTCNVAPAGAVGGGIILLILSLVYIGIMWLCRGQLQLVGKLFSIAGELHAFGLQSWLLCSSRYSHTSMRQPDNAAAANTICSYPLPFHGGKLIPRLHLPLALHRTIGRGLQACPAILTSTICIKLAGVGLLVFLFVGAVCAGFVGKVAPNPVRTYVSDGPNGYCLGTVMDAQGRTSPS